MKLLERLGLGAKGILPDVLWPTAAAKFEGLGAALRRERARGSIVLVVAHFPETFANLERCFAACGMEAQTVAGRTPGRSSKLGGRGGDPLRLVRADALVPAEHVSPRRNADVCVLVAERHPLRKRDENLVRRARWPETSVRLQFHLSLEDPLLESTRAGENARALLSRLPGLAGPCADGVSHPLVGRAIRGLQAQIARTARGDADAASAEEWFHLNGARTAA